MQSNEGAESGVVGAGVDADFILYVSANKSKACDLDVMAYASHCQIGGDFDRYQGLCS